MITEKNMVTKAVSNDLVKIWKNMENLKISKEKNIKWWIMIPDAKYVNLSGVILSIIFMDWNS